MDASTLKLPDGGCHTARIVENMREMAGYDVSNDTYCLRWDTLIHGFLRTHFEYKSQYEDGTVDEALIKGRRVAKAKFEAMENNPDA